MCARKFEECMLPRVAMGNFMASISAACRPLEDEADAARV
jgi:hypothetical protein